MEGLGIAAFFAGFWFFFTVIISLWRGSDWVKDSVVKSYAARERVIKQQVKVEELKLQQLRWKREEEVRV
jgi:hypothetical protein